MGVGASIMSAVFFDSPILNSPYGQPERHWELDEQGQPTSVIVHRRRQSALVSPIPKAKKIRGKAVQADFLADDTGQEYNPVEVINGIRSAVESWRRLPESQWQVTPTTARLLRHWRTHDFANQRPFFCQVEAVETVIWMTASEQKLVKITAFDLAQDETGNGLQLHRVEASPGFWTARVNQDIRIVLHKDGGHTLLAWVDHHDDAYRWAERRKIVPHERTGAMQIVEIVERTEERLVYTERVDDAPIEPVAVHRPFADLGDDELLSVGVPRDWLDAARG